MGQCVNLGDVLGYMQDHGLDEVRFVLDRKGEKTVVEVFFSEHHGDMMAVHIWDGERLGNICHLSSFRGSVFSIAEDNDSSENYLE